MSAQVPYLQLCATTAIAAAVAMGVLSKDSEGIPAAAEAPAATNAAPARVRPRTPVELVEETSPSAAVVESAPVQEAEQTAASVADVFAAKLAEASHLDIVGLFVEALAKVTAAEVPQLLEKALEKVTAAEVPDLLEKALEKVTVAEVPQLLAVLESKLSTMTVDDIKAIAELAAQRKWYEKFSAESGSKMYWILVIARAKAEQGEDVSKLEQEFYKSLAGWLNEED